MRKTTEVVRRKPSTSRSARGGSYGPPVPMLARRVWILGCEKTRVDAAVTFLLKAGHEVRGAEPGGDVGPTLRASQPELVVIDMASEPDRGRHLAIQLRADRGTRQLPIVLVGVPSQDGPKLDRAVPGPTRRYAGALDSGSVLEAIAKDL